MTTVATGFGSYVHAGMVRDAVRNTIQFWIDTYLDEMARSDGQLPGVLQSFRSYPDSIDGSTFPEEQIPSCVVNVPGITTKPEKTGKGAYRVQYGVGLGIVVAGPDKPRTVRLAQLYTLAVRLIMVQKRSLMGSGSQPFADGVEWMAEHFTDPAPRGARTLVSGILVFGVNIDNVADVSQGPLAPIPSTDAVTGWPTVATPEFGLKAYPVTQEVSP